MASVASAERNETAPKPPATHKPLTEAKMRQYGAAYLFVLPFFASHLAMK